MFEEQFVNRLTELRIKKGVSAREMSLSVGQSAGYINNIENGKNLPSMTIFFYICEYLGVTPKEFFDFENHDPGVLAKLLEAMKALNEEQLAILTALLRSWKSIK